MATRSLLSGPVLTGGSPTGKSAGVEITCRFYQPPRPVSISQSPGVGLQEAFEVRFQQAEMGLPFEVEVQEVAACRADERTLAALPWSVDEHGGERPEQPREALRGRSLDILHTLHFRLVVRKYKLSD